MFKSLLKQNCAFILAVIKLGNGPVLWEFYLATPLFVSPVEIETEICAAFRRIGNSQVPTLSSGKLVVNAESVFLLPLWTC